VDDGAGVKWTRISVGISSVMSEKYFIKIGTTKEDRKSKLVIPRLDRGIQ
jgi:hypothetical protein